MDYLCMPGGYFCGQTSQNAPYAKFAELRKAEAQLPRISILCSMVNKSMMQLAAPLQRPNNSKNHSFGRYAVPWVCVMIVTNDKLVGRLLCPPRQGPLPTTS